MSAPLLLKLKNKLKHIGERQVYAIAVTNRCKEGAWHLFYDYDKHTELVLDWWQKNKMPDMILAKTKHGMQFIGTECLFLKGVHEQFKIMQQIMPSDYFWSIPLWLRISAKWSEQGDILSEKPEYSNEYAEGYILKHFPIKKIYKTWV